MTNRKIVRWLSAVLLLCMLPTVAFAKTYKAWDIYNGDLDMTGVVLKKGDKLKGASNVSVSITYADSAGITVAEGDGTVKAVTISGEKVSEWAITDKYGSILAVGSWMQASVCFVLSPANGEFYGPTPSPTPTPTPTPSPTPTPVIETERFAFMVEGSDGRFRELTDENFEDATSHNGRKLTFAGSVSMAGTDAVVLTVANGLYVEVVCGGAFKAGDKVEGTGTINGSMEYEDGWLVVVRSDDIVKGPLYDPLQKGDKGEAVTEMKLRMQELGYFTAGASLSDQYNDTCVERVKQFQQKNGLEATGTADANTLAVLFSDAAVAK